jgi:hypothetical protein
VPWSEHFVTGVFAPRLAKTILTQKHSMSSRLFLSIRAASAFGLFQAAMLMLPPPSAAQAAPLLLNGSFESIGTLYNGAIGGLYEASSWTNLTGLNFQASSAVASSEVNPEYPGAANGLSAGSRYLRLVADGAAAGNRAALAQLVGSMITGETYRILGDVIAGPSDGGNFGATLSLVSNISLTPTTIYATQTVGGLVNGTYLSDGFDVTYTATAADHGQPLVVFLQAPSIADGTSTRGGVDDLRLTTVPEPTSALLFAGALAGFGFLRRRRA